MKSIYKPLKYIIMKNSLLVLLVFCLTGYFVKPVYAQVSPSQFPLNPAAIPKFVDALPHFAGIRVDATVGGNLIIRYEPTIHIAVSTGTVLATGTVGAASPNVGKGRYWGYSISKDGVNFTPSHWPAFSIEARRGIPLNVVYENKLDGETYASVNLFADQTLHWADPLMNMTMPMTPYMGPIPVSPHLHGGEVPSESDGGPESWFTPGYANTGPSWGLDGTDQNYSYPNTQEEATLWYHDHGLGVTRLNVYAGLAGFYILRGPQEEADKLPGWSGDDLVQEVVPVGKTGPFNPNPYLPEIEIVFQDRMFDTNGGLYFPNIPTNPMVHPYWTPEFIGNIITVNGKTWPYLSVAPRKYRFRLLNGSHARFYDMFLQGAVIGKMIPTITQIGTDGGLLEAPVLINGGKLLLAPGERADVVIDFSKSTPGAVWTLQNTAKVPYPNGTVPKPSTVGQLMQFIVSGKMVSATNTVVAGVDKSLVPISLRAVPLVKLVNFATGVPAVTPVIKRQLTLNEVMGMGGPLEVLVNNSKYDMNGMMTTGLGETELPTEGTTELWQIINTTADAHPLHLHLVQFQLVSRQPYNVTSYMKSYNAVFPGGTYGTPPVTYARGVYIPGFGPPVAYSTPNLDGAVGGNPAVTPFLQGKSRVANLNEQGWKDTFIAYPGEVTTFAIRFAPTDIPATTPATSALFAFDPSLGPGYVWHCHIIDHEDNEMMRPYKVIAQPRVAAAAALKNAGLSSPVNTGFALFQNSPNPFRTNTDIRFTLGTDCHVELVLYNSMGTKIKTLINADAPAGDHIATLYSDNLPSGIYIYQLKAGSFVESKKLVVIK